MSGQIGVSVVAGFLLLPLSATAEDAIPLKLRPPGQGDRTTTTFQSRTRIAVEKRDEAGTIVGDDLQIASCKLTLIDQILAGAGNQPEGILRHFAEARSTVNGQEKTLPFHDQTWIITRKGNAVTCTNENGEPLSEGSVRQMQQNVQVLQRCSTQWEEMIPGRPVKPGDAWTVDAAKWIKRDDVEAKVLAATGRLVKVYRREGRLCGVLEFRAEIALKAMTLSGRRMNLEPGSRILMKNRMETCVDGSSSWREELCSFVLTGKVRGAGPDGLDTKMDHEITLDARFSCK